LKYFVQHTVVVFTLGDALILNYYFRVNW